MKSKSKKTLHRTKRASKRSLKTTKKRAAIKKKQVKVLKKNSTGSSTAKIKKSSKKVKRNQNKTPQIEVVIPVEAVTLEAPIESKSTSTLKNFLSFPKKVGRWLVKHAKTLLLLAWFITNVGMTGANYFLYKEVILSFRVNPTSSLNEDFRGPLISTIEIPQIDINLPITPAYIIDETWQTSDTTASHLAASARPGEGSNIVIYGHNRPELMKNLDQIALGQEITLKAENGKLYHYQVETIKTVSPNQVDVVLPTDSEVLTVYTCTGFFSEKRLIVRAKPVGVTSPIVSVLN